MANRNFSGFIKGTTNGSSYEDRDGKFRMGTDNQLALIKDELKDRLVWSFTAWWSDTRAQFRKAVYEEAIAWAIDSVEFTDEQLDEMANWYAPTAPEEQQLDTEEARGRKYHIHHRQPCHNWWDPHDLDNMVVSSPRYHEEWFLTNEAHYGEYYWKKKDKEVEEKEDKRRSSIGNW